MTFPALLTGPDKILLGLSQLGDKTHTYNRRKRPVEILAIHQQTASSFKILPPILTTLTNHGYLLRLNP
jgi:hypothetical protein